MPLTPEAEAALKNLMRARMRVKHAKEVLRSELPPEVAKEFAWAKYHTGHHKLPNEIPQEYVEAIKQLCDEFVYE